MKIYGDETDDFDSHINIESLQYIIADMQRDLLSRDNQITILTAKLTEQEAELVKLRKVAEAAAAIRDLEQHIATLKADLAALREVEREKVAAWILSFGFATGHGDTIEDLLSEAGTQIQELRAAQEWVPVSERLPDNGVTVLIAGGCAYHLSHNGWFTLMGSDAHRRITWTVTHWMPLPLPPQPAQENAEDGV